MERCKQARETDMKQPGLGARHRTLLGPISQKHGNTLVATLRKEHGAGFLPQLKHSDDLKVQS